MQPSQTSDAHADLEPAEDSGSGRPRKIGYRRLPSDQRRDQIIEAAIITFGENPDASLVDVAATAGISRTSVYRFFETRQELLAAAFRSAGARLLEYVGDAPLNPPSEALFVRIHRFFDFIELHRTTYIGLMTWTSAVSSEEIQAVAQHVRDELCRTTYRVLEVERPSPLLEMTVRSWVSAVEHAALDWLNTGRPTRREAEILLSMHLASSLLNAAALDPAVAERVEWWLRNEAPDGIMGHYLRRLAGVFTMRITANVARLLAHGDDAS